MKTIKIQVQPYHDREAMIVALASSGRKVWVEEVRHFSEHVYLVCFNVVKGEIFDE